MRSGDYKLVEPLADEYKCVICHGLLIDACNAPCGCRFCSRCITGFLRGGDRHCPGQLEDCRDELINADRDVQRDHAINTRIERLLVKCPESPCSFSDELRRLEEHRRTCKTRKVACPFCVIGCGEMRIATECVGEHLVTETVGHTRLLLDCMDQMRNEIGATRALADRLQSTLNDTEETLARLQVVDAEKTKRLEAMEKRLQAVEKNHFKPEFSVVPFTEVGSPGFPGTRLLHEVVQQGLQEVVEEHKRKRRRIKEEVRLFEGKIRRLEAVQSRQACSEFVWRVDDFSEKRRVALRAIQDGLSGDLLSETFQSHHNGYRLRLVLCPAGSGSGAGSHVSVFFQLLRGELDSVLSWPMRHSVRVAVASQDPTVSDVSHYYQLDALPDKVKPALDRPTSEANPSCGTPKFISLSDLQANTALCKNDQIFLKCSVNVID